VSAGTDIAAEIAAALVEAGEATGDGALVCTLEQKTGGTEDPRTGPVATVTLSELVAVDFPVKIRDQAGMLVGHTVRTLTVNATGATPRKNDRVAVGVAPDVADEDSDWHRITEVRPLAPTGVALLYELEIED
jgi:hypothetical protein